MLQPEYAWVTPLALDTSKIMLLNCVIGEALKVFEIGCNGRNRIAVGNLMRVSGEPTLHTAVYIYTLLL